jgi:hypothetical protein
MKGIDHAVLDFKLHKALGGWASVPIELQELLVVHGKLDRIVSG